MANNKRETNAAATKRQRAKRRQYLFELKKGMSCVYCGETNPLVIDLDHVDRSTKRGVPSIMVTGGYKWQDVLDEIDKCQPVCANCHRIKSVLESGKMQAVDISQYIPDNMMHLLVDDYSHVSFLHNIKTELEREPSYTWKHDGGEVFEGNRNDLRNAHPELDMSSLRNVIEGKKQKQHKGWRLA